MQLPSDLFTNWKRSLTCFMWIWLFLITVIVFVSLLQVLF